jgi:hypothetical protein
MLRDSLFEKNQVAMMAASQAAEEYDGPQCRSPPPRHIERASAESKG